MHGWLQLCDNIRKSSTEKNQKTGVHCKRRVQVFAMPGGVESWPLSKLFDEAFSAWEK